MSSAAPGYSDVLVGLQYGDEGKAKVIDLLAPDYDVIARFNGGANAGHTIDTPQGRIALQQLPSGVFHPHANLYVGSGCAINVWKLVRELDSLLALGIDLAGRLRVSSRCAFVQPAHIAHDIAGGAYIGTTGNGMGPCYADRAVRMREGRRVNLQLRDVLVPDSEILAMLEADLDSAAFAITSEARARLHADLAALPTVMQRIRRFIEDDRGYLAREVRSGARVLFEGAQSIMLDVVEGDQPFVTASHTVPAFAYVGGDLPPKFHRRTVGVAKAIVSRVGQGPFPSEFGGSRSATYCADAARDGRGRDWEAARYDPMQLLQSGDPLDVGIALRILTGEYGTGTGRPRRIGMLDLQQLRRVIDSHGVDVVYINKFDCLSLFANSVYGGIPCAAVRRRRECNR